MGTDPGPASGPPPQRFDAIVLGAGISGLVAASVLQASGLERVAVVDTYANVGGNHIDVTHGGYTFDVGSFVFQDDSPLLEHFPELLEHYVPIDPRWSKLSPQGTIGSYPFSLREDVIGAGWREAGAMVVSALWARAAHRRIDNARDFARYWIGDRLLRRSGLESYMARFCGLPAEQIDRQFAETRMMWIAEHSSPAGLRRAVRSTLRPTPAAAPANRQLVRPREGFARLYAPARERLERQGAHFLLGSRLERLERGPSGWTLVTDSGELTAPRTVSTIPIDIASALCGTPRPGPLPTVTLITLFFSFAGRRGFDDSILYNFSHDGSWKRLTVYSDFYGPHDGREFFAVEVVAGDPVERPAAAAAAFVEHVTGHGLFTGDLRLEGDHVLGHAYPIYTRGSGEHAVQAVAALRAIGIESLGRQGSFSYQPTARVSTVEARRALEGPAPGLIPYGDSRPDA